MSEPSTPPRQETPPPRRAASQAIDVNTVSREPGPKPKKGKGSKNFTLDKAEEKLIHEDAQLQVKQRKLRDEALDLDRTKKKVEAEEGELSEMAQRMVRRECAVAEREQSVAEREAEAERKEKSLQAWEAHVRALKQRTEALSGEVQQREAETEAIVAKVTDDCDKKVAQYKLLVTDTEKKCAEKICQEQEACQQCIQDAKYQYEQFAVATAEHCYKQLYQYAESCSKSLLQTTMDTRKAVLGICSASDQFRESLKEREESVEELEEQREYIESTFLSMKQKENELDSKAAALQSQARDNAKTQQQQLEKQAEQEKLESELSARQQQQEDFEKTLMARDQENKDEQHRIDMRIKDLQHEDTRLSEMNAKLQTTDGVQQEKQNALNSLERQIEEQKGQLNNEIQKLKDREAVYERNTMKLNERETQVQKWEEELRTLKEREQVIEHMEEILERERLTFIDKLKVRERKVEDREMLVLRARRELSIILMRERQMERMRLENELAGGSGWLNVAIQGNDKTNKPKSKLGHQGLQHIIGMRSAQAEYKLLLFSDSLKDAIDSLRKYYDIATQTVLKIDGKDIKNGLTYLVTHCKQLMDRMVAILRSDKTSLVGTSALDLDSFTSKEIVDTKLLYKDESSGSPTAPPESIVPASLLQTYPLSRTGKPTKLPIKTSSKPNSHQKAVACYSNNNSGNSNSNFNKTQHQAAAPVDVVDGVRPSPSTLSPSSGNDTVLTGTTGLPEDFPASTPLFQPTSFSSVNPISPLGQGKANATQHTAQHKPIQQAGSATHKYIPPHKKQLHTGVGCSLLAKVGDKNRQTRHSLQPLPKPALLQTREPNMLP